MMDRQIINKNIMATEINTTSSLMMLMSSLTTLACIIFGHLMSTYQNIHLPPIIIEVLQCLSYGGGAIVACLTVYNFYKSHKKKK